MNQRHAVRATYSTWFVGMLCATVCGCSSSNTVGLAGDDSSVDSTSDDGSMLDGASSTGDVGGDGATADGAGAEASTSDGGTATGGDGSIVDGSAADGTGADGGTCGDTSSDPKNCGFCGHTCGTGQYCASGVCTCPPYSDFCGGACIPTSADPLNCGKCGVKCAAGLVCSASTCATDCLKGLSACAGGCVDTKTDNKNCGVCGKACAATEGCVDGTCVKSATLGPPPASCVGGGPPVSFGGPTPKCGAAVAGTTFTWAICSCKDVHATSKLVTDGFDSSKGAYTPGSIGAGVGLDGTFNASSVVDVGGTLWASSSTGLNASSDVAVRNELHLGGPLASALFSVSADAWVNGNISGGPTTIAGTLDLVAGATYSGVTYGALKRDAKIDVPPPCDCRPSSILPIGAIVAFRSTSNDNASIGLAADLLSKPGAPARVDLPCGNYYFDKIDATGALAIVAHGRTAIYVGGDVVSGSALSITLTPGAELDVLIAGTIRTTAALMIGSPAYPALSRTYVGGSDTLMITSDTIFGTNLYAANAPVVWTSNTDAYGGVFAGDFTTTSDTAIHFDRHVVDVGKECPPPATTSPGDAGSDASSKDAGASDAPAGTPCTSCKDCNNQACISGVCGRCGSSADCCAPLMCKAGFCTL